jgi:hypothetical protein
MAEGGGELTFWGRSINSFSIRFFPSVILKGVHPMKRFSLLLLALIGLLSAVPAMAMEYIDTQIGPDGIDVHLVKAKVLGDVLTMSIVYDNTTTSSVQILPYDISEVYVVAGQKKYPVLKDLGSNEWLAAPHVGDKIVDPTSTYTDKHFTLFKKQKQVVWFKFPAPPADVKEVEFQVPGVSPFDVTLTR